MTTNNEFQRRPGEIEALLAGLAPPSGKRNRRTTALEGRARFEAARGRARTDPGRERTAKPGVPQPEGLGRGTPVRRNRQPALRRGRGRSLLWRAGWLGPALATLVLGIHLGSKDPSESGRANEISPSPLSKSRSRPSASESGRLSALQGAATRRTRGLLSSPAPGWVESEAVLSAGAMRQAAELLLTGGSNRLERELLFPQLLARLTPENAGGMWEVLQESKWGNEGTHRIEVFAQLWGKLDGAAALAARSESKRWQALFSMRALEGWSEQEPQQAVAWVEQEGALTKPMRVALLKGLARSDPAAAAQHLLTLPSRSDPGLYLAPVVTSQLEMGFARAESWVTSLPTEDLRRSGLEQLGRQLAKEDLDRASQWVAGYATDPAAGAAIGAVAETLLETSFSASSDHDQEHVLTWLDSLPAGESRDGAYAATFQLWARRNVYQAGAALRELPASPAKDQAVRAFALQVRDRDPEAAVLWANFIEDPAQRSDTLYTTARHWYRKDRERSLQWMVEAELPDELLQRITGP